MTIAFDLDGTISRNPQLLWKLWAGVERFGVRSIVLTAAAGELPPSQRPAEVWKRLNGIGFPVEPKDIVCCESSEKGQKCRELGVGLLIDDSDDVIFRVRQESPSTLVLKVVP